MEQKQKDEKPWNKQIAIEDAKKILRILSGYKKWQVGEIFYIVSRTIDRKQEPFIDNLVYEFNDNDKMVNLFN